MNKYICYYGMSTCEVSANTTLGARDVAIAIFAKTSNPRKRIKPFEVSVMLAEKGDAPVIHTAT